MEVVLASVARLLYCGCSPVASRVPEVSGYQLRGSDQSERSESLTRRSKSKDGGFKPLFSYNILIKCTGMMALHHNLNILLVLVK